MNYYSAKAEHCYTYHRHDNTVPRAHLSGDLGWCQLCGTRDEQAVAHATWCNPISGETHEVVVCEKHKKHAHIVAGSCREGR